MEIRMAGFTIPHMSHSHLTVISYVSDSDNHRIQKFTGMEILSPLGGLKDQVMVNFLRPVGVAVDPEGSVFVADYYNHRIQKFDSEGSFVMTWGSEGSGRRPIFLP